MEEGEFLSELPPEEKTRLAYIEGREDLFRTRVLEFEQEEGNILGKEATNIVVESRDPGGANALVPVLELLQKQKDVKIKAITDGRAQEIFQKNFKTKDITPEDNILRAAELIGSPDLALIGISDESGIEMFVSATFPEVPSVLVEDYYSASSGYLQRLKDGKLPYPKKICVIDEGAKDILIRKFPDLEGRVEVTGQPKFDKIAIEDTEKIEKEVKRKLGLTAKDKLVSFMSTTIDGVEKIKEIASAIQKTGSEFYFAFKRHPRDNISYAEYKKIFEDAGIKIIDTEEFTVDEIGAASDVVLTTWSTVGIDAIYRRKPVANIVDFRYPVPEGYDFPLAPVKLQASAGVDHIEQLTEILPQLLDKKSSTNAQLLKNIEKHYKLDGKSAERVVNIINQFTIKSEDER